MKNKINNKGAGFVKDRLKSPKFLIVASCILALLADAFAVAAFLIGGYDYTVFILPMILLVLDGILLATTLASNFRFSYSFLIPVLYMIFVVGIGVWTYFSNGIWMQPVRFSNIAMYVWLGLHAIACFAVLFTALRAACYGKKGKGFVGLGGLFFLALTAACGVYGYSVVNYGLYGQGEFGKVRTLEYTYDAEEGFYRVTGVMSGKGDTVVVPEQFNGVPVGAIDCNILKTSTVTNVHLASTAIEFVNRDALAEMPVAGRKIYVQKAECEDFRDGCYALAYNYYALPTMSEGYLALANSIVPEGLSEGEVYVSFHYEMEDFLAVGGKTLDIWYGNAGDVFSAASYGDVEYVANGDVTDVDEKYWSYDHLNKRIFNGFKVDGQSVEGVVSQSLTAVDVTFEKLYEVVVGDDNDTRYEPATSFKKQAYNGTQRNHVVTKGNADTYLASIEARDGFSLAWQYGGDKYAFSSLKAILSDGVVIYPRWTMNTPTIDSISVSDTTATYGDVINFLSTATPASSNFSLRYSWRRAGGEVSTSSNWTDDCIKPEEAGAYVLTVESYGADTSLTSTISKEVSLTVAKKSLPFHWTLPSDNVYSASEKPILCAYEASALVGSDSVVFSVSTDNVRDAGTYTSVVTLSGDWGNYYEIPTQDRSTRFTVVPYAIEVTWSNTSLVYNAIDQMPMAAAMGLGSDGALDLTVLGAQRNASDNAYTAIVTTTNPNYIISNPTHAFTIAKAGLTVTWSNTSLIYNASNQKPTATATGLGSDGAIVLTVSGAEKYASSDAYTASVATANTNYYIVNPNVDFTIEKANLTVTWSNTSLTYNAREQKPTARATGLGADGAIALTVTGAQINASDSAYTATAETTNTNYNLLNATKQFTIGKANLTVAWSNTSLTYNASEQKPTATATGLGSDGAIALTVTGAQINASDSAYTATAETTNTNYKLVNATKQFTIGKANLTVTWSNTSLTYNASEQMPTATATGLGSDGAIALTVSGAQINASDSAYTATATTDNTNYKLTNASVRFTIGKANLTVAWSNTSLTYNASEQMPTATATGLGADGAIALTVTGAKINASDSAYTATAETTNTNYKLVNATKQFTIAKKDVTLTWGATQATYDDTVKVVEPTLEGVVAGDASVVAYTYTKGGVAITKDQVVDAGVYQVTATIDDGNYQFAGGVQTQFTFTILPKQITVSVDGTSFEYDGGAKTPAFVASDVQAALSVVYYHTAVAAGNELSGAPSEVGDYFAVVTTVSGNYAISGATVVSFAIVAAQTE